MNSDPDANERDDSTQDFGMDELQRGASDPSRRIGPYKLLRQIGVGGMGEVWMAEQEQPIRRRVALKLIKYGRDDKQILARFESERQALAMMDHQNVARILDAGTADDGAPYFVMELVQGEPITAYCDHYKLSVSDRLQLFIPVCEAVRHAHQKGIIHRDLKPSNILVHIYDGKPVAKVIDFGLAKALQHQTRLTDKTVFTELGQVVGTVQYMSPEQARLDALDVDTRTDIYSLGVILYELLAGSTPIERSSLEENALLKVLDMIRETEPPRPSQRLSSSVNKLDSISQQRQITPSKLQQILRGELDWIVMKALDKDRTRRYATPNDFADDLRHYLSGEAVLARPPSAGYRLRKFVRKHRVLVATSAAIMASLAAGITGIRERDNARQQRNVAQQMAELARNAVDDYAGLSQDPRIRSRDLDDVRTELLESAIDSYEEMAMIESDAPELLAARADALQRLSRLTTNNDSIDRGISQAAEAAGILRSLAQQFPNNLEYMRQYFDVQIDVGNRFRSRGDMSKAQEAYQNADWAISSILESGETIWRDHFANANLCGTLGNLYREVGRADMARDVYQDAILQFEEVLSMQPGSLRLKRYLASTYQALATCEEQLGEYDKAKLLYSKSIQSLQQLTDEFPEEEDNWFHLAAALDNSAWFYGDLGELQQARACFDQAVALMQKCADAHSDSMKFPYELAKILSNQGACFGEWGLWYDAKEVLTKSRDCLIEITTRDPEREEFKVELAKTCSNLGRVLGELGEGDAADEEFSRAKTIQESIASRDGKGSSVELDHATTLINAGSDNLKQGHLAEAQEQLLQAMAIWDSRAEQSPDFPVYQIELSKTLNNLGLVCSERGELRQAEDYHHKVIAIRSALVEKFPQPLPFRQLLASAHRNLGAIHQKNKQYQQAFSEYRFARDIYRDIHARVPALLSNKFELAQAEFNIGNLYAEWSQPDHAVLPLQASIEICEQLIAVSPRHDYQDLL